MTDDLDPGEYRLIYRDRGISTCAWFTLTGPSFEWHIEARIDDDFLALLGVDAEEQLDPGARDRLKAVLVSTVGGLIGNRLVDEDLPRRSPITYDFDTRHEFIARTVRGTTRVLKVPEHGDVVFTYEHVRDPLPAAPARRGRGGRGRRDQRGRRR